MGKSSSPPEPPDPVQTSQAQAAANKETAIAQAGLNAVNQVTPYGNLTYANIGNWSDGTPRYQANVSLSPEQQSILNAQNRADLGLANLGADYTSRIRDATASPFSLDQFGPAPTADNAARGRYEEALMARLNPQLERDRSALEQRMADQGISLGSEAYGTAFGLQGQKENDARMQSILAGGDEMARMYGLERTAYQDRIGNALLERNQPINEVAGLMSGSGVQMPSFVNTPQTGVAPTDVLGAYGLQQKGQQAEAAGNASNNQATAGLIGSAAMAAAMFF